MVIDVSVEFDQAFDSVKKNELIKKWTANLLKLP